MSYWITATQFDQIKAESRGSARLGRRHHTDRMVIANHVVTIDYDDDTTPINARDNVYPIAVAAWLRGLLKGGQNA